jgi:hypothetical protein
MSATDHCHVYQGNNLLENPCTNLDSRENRCRDFAKPKISRFLRNRENYHMCGFERSALLVSIKAKTAKQRLTVFDSVM